MTYIPFTDAQKQAANQVDLVALLRGRGEPLKREGREYRWQRYPGVVLSGNRWYDHYQREGGYPVKFLQRFFGLDYRDAMAELLGSSATLTPLELFAQENTQPKKQFCLPQANADMQRVYAYLMQQRHIAREVIDLFVAQQALYEDVRHNAVFVGLDENGTPRSAHKKGTLSGISYRRNVAGSDERYGFGYAGNSSRLYVFEAAVDLLSYLTLYPENCWEHCYVALGGVSEHAMLQMLKQNPVLQEVYLCLDHDAAGIEACGRLADILRENGYGKVYRALPELKDWNELLKSQHGLDAIPATEHPKVEAMRALCRSLSLEQPDTIQPYKKLFRLCEQYQEKRDAELLYEAAKAALFCVSDQLWKASKPATVEKIAACVFRGYQPYRDHGNTQAHEKELAECLEKIKREMSPAGVYTAQQRAALAQHFLSLTQACLTAQLCRSEQSQVQNHTQKIAG